MKPFHHPHIWNDCTKESGSCSLNITTITDNGYTPFEEYQEHQDSVFISANEILIKNKSKQSILEKTIDSQAGQKPVESMDPDTTCMDLNQHSLQIALEYLPTDRYEFYKKNGIPFEFEKDWSTIVYPLWIMSPLKLEKRGNGMGRKWMIKSTSFLSSVHFQAKGFDLMAGLHYCKLVSPARLFELMMTF